MVVKLIDAAEAEKKILDYGKKQIEDGRMTLDTVDDIISLARELCLIPAQDAVPVVHGQWIWSEENECWVCSNCEMSAANNYRGNSTDSNYCPNCGAKMDGGVENAKL